MTSHCVNIYEAKTQLSRLVDRAAAGEEILIARHGRPLAKLSPLEPGGRAIVFGLLEGHIEIADDFDAPLPDDVLSGFHRS